MGGSLSGPEIVASRHEFVLNTLGPRRDAPAAPGDLARVADEVRAGAVQAGVPDGAVLRVAGWWEHVLRGPVAVELVGGIAADGQVIAPDHDHARGWLSLVAHDEQWWDLVAPCVDARLFDGHPAQTPGGPLLHLDPSETLDLEALATPYAEGWSGPSNEQLRQWQGGRTWREYDEDPDYIRQVLENQAGSYSDSTVAALAGLVEGGRVTTRPPSAAAAASQPAKKRGIFRR